MENSTNAESFTFASNALRCETASSWVLWHPPGIDSPDSFTTQLPSNLYGIYTTTTEYLAFHPRIKICINHETTVPVIIAPTKGIYPNPNTFSRSKFKKNERAEYIHTPLHKSHECRLINHSFSAHLGRWKIIQIWMINLPSRIKINQFARFTNYFFDAVSSSYLTKWIPTNTSLASAFTTSELRIS